mmetsp:Transcript_126479/g.404045  ORF Transcript_126479/g.404045 Transcript_126479/m.404045 type:complete len:259 (+) Transcript_126479:175-951(+)
MVEVARGRRWHPCHGGRFAPAGARSSPRDCPCFSWGAWTRAIRCHGHGRGVYGSGVSGTPRHPWYDIANATFVGLPGLAVCRPAAPRQCLGAEHHLWVRRQHQRAQHDLRQRRPGQRRPRQRQRRQRHDPGQRRPRQLQLRGPLAEGRPRPDLDLPVASPRLACAALLLHGGSNCVISIDISSAIDMQHQRFGEQPAVSTCAGWEVGQSESCPGGLSVAVQSTRGLPFEVCCSSYEAGISNDAPRLLDVVVTASHAQD